MRILHVFTKIQQPEIGRDCSVQYSINPARTTQLTMPLHRLVLCVAWRAGTGTAGLGGRAGPYRLDKGQDIYLLSEEEKNDVDDETKRRAKEMATAAYEAKLKVSESFNRAKILFVLMYTIIGVALTSSKPTGSN